MLIQGMFAADYLPLAVIIPSGIVGFGILAFILHQLDRTLTRRKSSLVKGTLGISASHDMLGSSYFRYSRD
jgi:hypothetical protein